MNLHELLHTTARRSPEAEAVSCGGARLSYAELAARVRRLGNVLLAEGLERGERLGKISWFLASDEGDHVSSPRS